MYWTSLFRSCNFKDITAGKLPDLGFFGDGLRSLRSGAFRAGGAFGNSGAVGAVLVGGGGAWFFGARRSLAFSTCCRARPGLGASSTSSSGCCKGRLGRLWRLWQVEWSRVRSFFNGFSSVNDQLGFSESSSVPQNQKQNPQFQNSKRITPPTRDGRRWAATAPRRRRPTAATAPPAAAPGRRGSAPRGRWGGIAAHGRGSTVCHWWGFPDQSIPMAPAALDLQLDKALEVAGRPRHIAKPKRTAARSTVGANTWSLNEAEIVSKRGGFPTQTCFKVREGGNHRWPLQVPHFYAMRHRVGSNSPFSSW